jgi:hypothetical protein
MSSFRDPDKARRIAQNGRFSPPFSRSPLGHADGVRMPVQGGGPILLADPGGGEATHRARRLAREGEPGGLDRAGRVECAPGGAESVGVEGVGGALAVEGPLADGFDDGSNRVLDLMTVRTQPRSQHVEPDRRGCRTGRLHEEGRCAATRFDGRRLDFCARSLVWSASLDTSSTT